MTEDIVKQNRTALDKYLLAPTVKTDTKIVDRDPMEFYDEDSVSSRKPNFILISATKR